MAGRRALLVVLAAALVPAGCGGGDAGPAGAGAREGRPPVRGVVLFTVDTLRADVLGCYGGPVETPAFDRLAAEALLFERAYTQATLTHPALASVLSGLLPWRHGVGMQSSRLHPNVRPLPALLAERGVATGSFVANLCKLQEQEGTVFRDGWDVVWCGMPPDDAYDEQHRWDERVVSAGLDWAAAQDGPFLCWIHLMDPHAEHRPDPADWDYAARPVLERFEQYRAYNAYEEERTFPPPERMEHLWDLYEAEVRGVDRQLARVLDALADDPDVALVVTSDHGEELYETWSRYDHGLSMTEGVLWVPLLLRAPGVAPGRTDRVVETLQITPTVLELLGAPAPYRLDGPSLLAPGGDRGFALSFTENVSVSMRTPEHRYWFRNTVEPWTRPPDQAPWRADAPWFREAECLARYPEPDHPTAVAWLEPDAPEHAEVRETLRARLTRFLRTLGPPRATERIEDEGLAEQLRGLGYAGD